MCCFGSFGDGQGTFLGFVPSWLSTVSKMGSEEHGWDLLQCLLPGRRKRMMIAMLQAVVKFLVFTGALTIRGRINPIKLSISISMEH